MDSQTRVEHTLALAALVQAMVKELAEHFEQGRELSRYPYEMLDENKWLAARHGLDGCAGGPAGQRAACRCQRAGPARCSTGSTRTRRSSAPRRSSKASRTCSRTGNGASRQVVVYEANHDLREVVREIVDEPTVPEAAETPGD